MKPIPLGLRFLFAWLPAAFALAQNDNPPATAIPGPGSATGVERLTTRILGVGSPDPTLGYAFEYYVYDAWPAGLPTSAWGPRLYSAPGKLANLSLRGTVGSGDQVLVGGFTIREGRRIVLIRAVGPTLGALGVKSPLARPRLELRYATGGLMATAVPWSSNSESVQTELKAATTAAGAFPLLAGSQDQVILIVLDAGGYTCTVSGLEGSTGTALLEVYEVPSLVPAGVSFPPPGDPRIIIRIDDPPVVALPLPPST